MNREDAERRIRISWDEGDFRAAAEIAIREYGPEIVSYLAALSGDATRAGDAFSVFAEDLWQYLPGFRWECALRSWAYGLARHALFRLARDPYHRRARPLSQSPELERLAQEVRTTTAVHLRTDTKDRLAALRDRLDPRDRELLILRIDRHLSWQDVARIQLAGELSGDEPAEAELARAAGKLRKRFERVKETLRKHLAEDGTDGGPGR